MPAHCLSCHTDWPGLTQICDVCHHHDSCALSQYSERSTGTHTPPHRLRCGHRRTPHVCHHIPPVVARTQALVRRPDSPSGCRATCAVSVRLPSHVHRAIAEHGVGAIALHMQAIRAQPAAPLRAVQTRPGSCRSERCSQLATTVGPAAWMRGVARSCPEQLHPRESEQSAAQVHSAQRSLPDSGHGPARPSAPAHRDQAPVPELRPARA